MKKSFLFALLFVSVSIINAQTKEELEKQKTKSRKTSRSR